MFHIVRVPVEVLQSGLPTYLKQCIASYI